MENVKIRRRLKAEGIPFWLLAEKMGVCELTVTRWFRVPLDEDKRRKVEAAIAAILDERGEAK